MKKQHTLIKGTLILTITGFVSRIIGFFYRIFLSRTIGAEGVGIYQLIFPVYIMCFSLTSAGIETTISKFVASKVSVNDHKSARDILHMGLLFSLSLALLSGYIIFNHSGFIAETFLDEPRTESLLRVMVLTLPFCSIHSCIAGYYYGLKKTTIPALMQMLEQLTRVVSVYVLYLVYIEKGAALTPQAAVLGLVFGEIASMLVSVTALTIHFNTMKLAKTRKRSKLVHMKNIMTMSVPLTCNRVLINLLQSAEAVLIPGMLRKYGLTSAQSLSIYGILNGMSLPLILFPSAITNSVSVMLLPMVSEAQAVEQDDKISRIVKNTIKYCLILGILCTGVFLTFGNEMGTLLFDSQPAGSFIVTLAWICPFLYLSSTLNSILHGLGKSVGTFIDNIISLSIRILFVLFMIPKFGITGYLWGLLISQFVSSALSLLMIRRCTKISFPFSDGIIKPLIALGGAVAVSGAAETIIQAFPVSLPLITALLSGMFMCVTYLFLIVITGALPLKKSLLMK